MKPIETVIDELYPLKLRVDEIIQGSNLNKLHIELSRGIFDSINIKECLDETLLFLFESLHNDNTTIFRDMWRNAIRTELLNRCANNQHFIKNKKL